MASGRNVPVLHRHLFADLGLILMFEVDDIYRRLIIMKKKLQQYSSDFVASASCVLDA